MQFYYSQKPDTNEQFSSIVIKSMLSVKKSTNQTMQFRTLIQATRPSFLILSPVCVFLGASIAMAANGSVDTATLILVVIGALCAHISVNTLNEYADFKSGLDLITVKTPFSGGSGALPDNPAMANAVLATGLITLAVTSTVGLYFVNKHEALLFPIAVIGIIGIFIILTYSKWINRWPFFCLLAPGLGFGGLMVIGTYFVLTSATSITPWLAALVPFFLVSNLLLLNQYPDIQADKSVGRNHFPIAYGTRTSSYVYGIFFMSAYSTILLGIYYGYFPGLSVIAILPAALSIYSLTGAFKHAENIGAHTQYLGTNVAATLLAPLLLGISITFG
jgi:1,4-dihydroxy-2-naphthoate octaprenyltransferase